MLLEILNEQDLCVFSLYTVVIIISNKFVLKIFFMMQYDIFLTVGKTTLYFLNRQFKCMLCVWSVCVSIGVQHLCVHKRK